MTDPKDKTRQEKSSGAPDFAGYLRREYPSRPAEAGSDIRVPTDPPPPGDPESDMRDIEKALVERIADVDDDRRRTAVQLRKALETHRDEIRAQRRRDHTAIVVLAGISIILLATGALLFADLLKTRGSLSNRLAAMEQQGANSAPAAASSDTGQVEGTDQTAESIDSRLTALERRGVSAATVAGDNAESSAAEQIEELADAVESIGDRLASLEGTTRRMGDAAGSPDTAETGPNDGLSSEVRAAEARMEQLLDERLMRMDERLDRLRADIGGGAAEAEPKASAPTPSGGQSGISLKPIDGGVVVEQPTVVVQLAGFRERADIDAFIARHELAAPVYLRIQSWRGRPWYALINSLHSNMAQAEAASAELPPDLAKLDIWLRDLPAGTRLQILGNDR